MKARFVLRRLHIWLGWLVGVPLVLWTVTGLFMATQPIQKVRGEHLLRDAPALSLPSPPVSPAIGPRPVRSLMLEQQAGGPVWIVRYADGQSGRASAQTGQLLPPLTTLEAAGIVRARYKGASTVSAVDKRTADKPPIDLRRNVETFRVTMRDGARFYVDAATGEILARRTGQWHLYDFMWGLHIMDLQTRQDLNNLWLVVFAAISLASIVMALVLLPAASRRRR
jgi:hypothetical protein